MALQRDPIASATRQEVRKRRLPPDASCAFCGITDPVQLTRRRRRLEEHHVAGRANDVNLVAVLCLNCHASVSERQRDAGLFSVGEPTNLLERLALILVSLATFAEALAATLRARAQELFELITSLDRRDPGWRTLGPAT